MLHRPLLTALSPSVTRVGGLVRCSGRSGVLVQGFAICERSEEKVYDGKVRK